MGGQGVTERRCEISGLRGLGLEFLVLRSHGEVRIGVVCRETDTHDVGCGSKIF